MKNGDLLNKLGSKTSGEGVDKSTPSQSSATATTSENTASTDNTALNRGLDMLKTAATKSDTVTSIKTNTGVVEPNTASTNKVEPSGSADNNNEWTLENALKEVKKLRDENKTTRIKYAEAVEKLKVESDSRISAKDQEFQELAQKAQELEQIKAKEEDRKRDLSEKLAHREALAAELRIKLEAQQKIADEKIRTMQTEVEQYRAESEAQLEVYKQRLNNELSVIPEKYKDIASLIVKGAGDPRDAIVALNEAKLRGVFEDKTVIVSHSVPGAGDGARSSKDKLDAAATAAREKLDSSTKIREGLKAIRSGETNSAFRIR